MQCRDAVNGFVNETRRNVRDSVTRGVTTATVIGGDVHT
jgi:hypothetical protein